VVEKGTPIFVQLDTTLDVDQRKVNGVEIARAEAEASAKNNGRSLGQQQVNYPPGDARAKYTGSNANGQGIKGSVASQANNFLSQLQQLDPQTQSQIQAAQANLRAAQGAASQSSQNTQGVQQLLQNIGGQ
jgi:hypothetical protein